MAVEEILKIDLKRLFLPEVPFAPRRMRFHYGWVILVLSVMVMVASTPGQTIGVGLFTDFLLVSLPFTRVELSFFYLLATTLSALALPRVGYFMDLWGERSFATVAAVGAGFSLLLMLLLTKFVPDLGVAFREVELTTSWLMLAMSMIFIFFLLRFSSQGILVMVSRNILARWFIEKRARMTVMTGIFISFYFAIAPYFLNWVIESEGTPYTLFLLFVVLTGWCSVLFYIFVRSTPEECGLAPDNRYFVSTSKEVAGASTHDARMGVLGEQQFTLSAAIRTHIFWLFSAAITWQGLYVTGFIFHITSIGEAAGYGRTEVFSFFPILALFSVLSQITFGFWSERKDIRVAHYALILALMISGFAMTQLQEFWGISLMFVSMGVSVGTFNLVSTVGFAAYFGRKSLGAIQGFHMRNVVMGSAVAPWLFAWTETIFATYQVIAWILVSTGMVLLVASLTIPSPKSFEQKTNQG